MTNIDNPFNKTESWTDKVHSFLDDIEINPSHGSELSWKTLCSISGKSRSTLWRNQEIRNHYAATKEIIKKYQSEPSTSIKRRSSDQKIRKLKLQNEHLIERNNYLYEMLVSMIDKLDEHNIDPATFMLSAGINLHK